TTTTTCSSRIVFRLIVARQTFDASFVAQVLDKLAVRPLADALVLFATLIRSISDVAHVANRNLADIVVFAKLHHLTTGFMQDVGLLPVELGRCLRKACAQVLHAPTTWLARRHALGIGSMTLVAQPFERAQVATSDHDARAFIADDRSDVD